MAEAHSAIQVLKDHKVQGIKLFVDDQGIEVSFVIPHPRQISRAIVRKYHR